MLPAGHVRCYDSRHEDANLLVRELRRDLVNAAFGPDAQFEKSSVYLRGHADNFTLLPSTLEKPTMVNGAPRDGNNSTGSGGGDQPVQGGLGEPVLALPLSVVGRNATDCRLAGPGSVSHLAIADPVARWPIVPI